MQVQLRQQGRARLGLVVAGLLASALAGAGVARAESEEPGFCNRPFTRDSLFRSEASKDLYNGVLWMGGVAGVQFGADTKRRWSRTNSFDRDVRDAFRRSSREGRDAADTASDVFLGFSVGVMPLAAMSRTLAGGDCHETYDMATDLFESVTLTLLLTESAKHIAGRERPYVQTCDSPSPPGDAECDDDDRKESFFSGHSSLAAAGAGVSCAWAIKKKTWGESAAARYGPCALGTSFALTTGALRIVADKHWGTDVLVGLAVGATVGWFDTWGPFDLLRFEVASDDRAWDVKGMVLPYAADGELGARLALTF